MSDLDDLYVRALGEASGMRIVKVIDEDGDSFTTDMRKFLVDNREDLDLVDQVMALDVGEQVKFGGGAAPLVTVRRIA